MRILIILSLCLGFLYASITLPLNSNTNIKITGNKTKPMQVKIYDDTYVLNPKKDLFISVGNASIVLVDISEEGIKNRKVIKKQEDLLKDVWIEE